MSNTLRSHFGFTLVELLVVLLIIGLGVSLVSLQVGTNRGRELHNEASVFATQGRLLVEEAVLSGSQWGIDVFRSQQDGKERIGYRYLQLQRDGWQPAAPRDFEPEILFAPATAVLLELEGAEVVIEEKQLPPKKTPEKKDEDQDDDKNEDVSANDDEALKPEIVLYSSREVTPFVLTLRDSGEEVDERDGTVSEVRIEADLLGRFVIDGDEDDAEDER